MRVEDIPIRESDGASARGEDVSGEILLDDEVVGKVGGFGNISPRNEGLSDVIENRDNLPEKNIGVKISALQEAVRRLFNRLRKITGDEDGSIGNLENRRRADRGSSNEFKSDDPEDLGRRKFLKLGGAVVAMGALYPSGLLSNEKEEMIREEKKIIKKELQGIRDKIYQEEQENIRIENAIALREVLGEQYLRNGRVEINEKTMRDIRYYWMKEYQKGGRQHLGLMGSLERMRPWYNEIKKIFINNLPGVDERTINELIYLTIPESHFKIGAKSRAGAKGEYQMMPNTARGEGGLIVDDKVDERLDILANAKGAAKTLFNYYKIAKNDKNSSKDAWGLALAKFNGGYIGKYLKDGSISQVDVGYKNYLKFREDRLNSFFKQVEQDGVIARDVRSGESLKSIAKKYGVAQNKLKLITRGDSNKKAVVIPIKISKNGRINSEVLDVIFDDYLPGSLENLNYPEKFYAVIKVLEKEDLMLDENSDTEQIEFRAIGELELLWAYWKKHGVKNRTLIEVNKFFHPPGREDSLQRLEEGNPHIKGNNVNLSDPKYDDVKIYFLDDEVLDTQFIEFPTLGPEENKRRP